MLRAICSYLRRSHAMNTDDDRDRLSPEEADELIKSIADVEREEAEEILDEKDT